MTEAAETSAPDLVEDATEVDIIETVKDILSDLPSTKRLSLVAYLLTSAAVSCAADQEGDLVQNSRVLLGVGTVKAVEFLPHVIDEMTSEDEFEDSEG